MLLEQEILFNISFFVNTFEYFELLITYVNQSKDHSTATAAGILFGIFLTRYLVSSRNKKFKKSFSKIQRSIFIRNQCWCRFTNY